MSRSDILSGHLHGSGFIYKNRARVKALDVVGSSSAGVLEIWDSTTAPIAGTYGRSGDTVTVTDNAHGLSTGDLVGISFDEDSGNIATPGNYEITVVDANTFTLTDINSGTIANDPTCRYVPPNGNGSPAQWKATWHTSATDIFFNGFTMPSEGLLCRNAIYIYATNISSVNIYYA